MDTVIREYLNQTKIGRKQSFKNLALYPLLSTYSSGLLHPFQVGIGGIRKSGANSLTCFLKHIFLRN
jgi:hypothetical protein